MKTLGIIGGAGPMATAYFMQMVIEMTDAGVDQEHIKMVVINDPQIPDRTAYLLGKSTENPYPDMLRIGQQLLADDAEVIAMPCITASVFLDQLSQELGVPVIHGIRETAAYLNGKGIRQVGLLATDGTVRQGLFQETLSRAGLKVHLPDAEGQKGVMKIIYEQIKAGKPADTALLDSVSSSLLDKGAQVTLLGCTELSLVRWESAPAIRYLDVMRIMAKTAVEQCGSLKPEYKELI